MQVSNPNNVKIYNLSAGKSLPEWLSEKKRRNLQKHDTDIQKRIELIQGFEMPTVSHCVQVTKDGQYICATGTYKPRFRCYDVGQMSLKFERGLDADVVKFAMLSEDYSKVVFLQCDRYIEVHSQFGRYYRTRVPKFGRDLAYHNPSCDLYIVGVSTEIYRLNLEQGRFLNPLSVDAAEVNCCEFNDVHQLFACGTSMGTVECFDPRSRTRVGILDVALSSHVQDLDITAVPAVSAIKFRDALNFAVGTTTGHILLYDIRSNKPIVVKDHQFELPIKNIQFHEPLDLVLSMDTKILKIWHRDSGKPFTSIEPGTDLNDLCLLPESGLLFMANEAPKMLSYYIPTLGTAPKWCSFLDNLTEELEENTSSSVYDDYKFVTRKELEDLGLTHLIGSSLLRAYMHGFFMDFRLYNKAKAIAEPFAYEEYRKSKIREKIEKERENRVRVKKLPKVNKDLAEKLLDAKEAAETGKEKKTKKMGNLLDDDRFGAMFTDPEYQIDSTTEEYRLMNPVVSKLDKQKQKKQAQRMFEEIKDGSDEEKDDSDAGDMSEESSSDDDHTWTEELRKQHRLSKQQQRLEERAARPKFYQLKEGQDLHKGVDKQKKKETKKSFAERLETLNDSSTVKDAGTIGNKEMTFRWKKSSREIQKQQANREHHKEREKIRRSAAGLKSKRRGFSGSGTSYG